MSMTAFHGQITYGSFDWEFGGGAETGAFQHSKASILPQYQYLRRSL